MYAYICMCVRKRRERKRVEGRSIIIYMAPPLAWVLPWQHNGRRPDNRVTVVMNTPGNCWCQCSKVSPKVPLGWSKRSYTNAHTHARSARAGQLFGIWEVFDLINNERGDDGKWKKRAPTSEWTRKTEGKRRVAENERDGERWRALPWELFPIHCSYNGVIQAHFPKKLLGGKIICSIMNRWTEKCPRCFCDPAHIYCNSGQMDSEVTRTRQKRGGRERQMDVEREKKWSSGEKNDGVLLVCMFQNSS